MEYSSKISMISTDIAPNTKIKPFLLPNFLIVGAAHSGTTSLYFYLRQHPEIFMPMNPKSKEPTHFVSSRPGVAEFHKYASLFRDAIGKKAIGEASTAYLYCEESAERIKSVLGQIKIIIILRDPAKRAFSNYNWMIRQGWEDAATFEEGLKREPFRLRDPYFRERSLAYFADYFYFDTGLFYRQVKQYFDTFGKDRVKVYLFEEFAKDPQAICRDIFGFLGVDTTFNPAIEVHNEGRRPLSVKLQSWAQSVAMGQKTCHSLRLVPRRHRGKVIGAIKKVNTRLGHKAHIPPEMYEQLSQRYRSDIARLESLLGKDLSLWSGKL